GYNRSMTLDLAYVRARFPGLRGSVALMDNAGGSVPTQAVVDAIHTYLTQDMVQLGASYDRSAQATSKMTAGKEAAATLLGCAFDDVVLSASTSSNMFVLARAFAPLVGPGDEVVITEIDHEANRGAWRRLAEERGAQLRIWRLQEERLTAAGLAAVLTERTRVVAFTHCANVIGTVHDVRGLCRTIRDAGAISVVDGVAYAPHRRVDAPALGADVYVMSLYKVYGPHLSAAYVAPALRDRLANQNHDFLEETGSYRFMPGNASHELAASLPGIVAYLRGLDRHHGGPGELDGAWDLIRAQEATLGAPLLAYLRDHPKVRLIGEPDITASGPDPRVTTIAFTVHDRPSASIPPALDDHCAIRWGHFYAYEGMKALGLDPAEGIARISLVHYNTVAEVDRLIERLDEVLSAP
ncbi:MAG: aminotransferase class V-fold PLP-dependent enzyme, partial [Myxococcota bacterium]